MTLREEYFDYLYKLISPLPRTYYKLCRELHNKKFVWTVRNDDNRLEDGLNLRQIFIEEANLDETHIEVVSLLNADCSVFEMLIALAQRMDYQLSDLIAPANRTNKYFLEMIRNLKLDGFTDNSTIDTRFDPVSEAEIDDILESMINRTYDYDGNGGVFPLKFRPPKDMSKVELWYQMMLYINENYG